VSRRRRPFLYDRYIFVTINLLKSRAKLRDTDLVRLAHALTRRRRQPGLALTAWVFLPEHGHAIIYPPYPLTLSRVFQAVKVSSTLSINLRRREAEELWPGCFFDHALRTVKEYRETVAYLHRNPVRRGLGRRAEDWKWSSLPEYAGVSGEEQERRCGLRLDRVRLPAEENTRI